jgi:AcrR family transcriptional regulator
LSVNSKLDPERNPVSFDLTSREPQQGRSRASLERMLEAAEQLMMRVGSDDFTLTEVAKVGNVSIGSIYLRFEGKDALIHAVHSRVLERINAEQDALLERVSAASSDLDGFTHAFVDEYAEMLLKFAPILRPIMLRAPHDPVMSKTGKDNYERFADKVKSRLLDYRSDFGRPDHDRLVNSAYRVIYATVARFLGLGSSLEASGEGDWAELKEDLGAMCSSFLRAP